MLINIDSKNRAIGSEFQFSSDISPPVQNVNKMKIKSIEIPVAWYNVREHMNILRFNIYDSGNTFQSLYTLTIAPSNYSAQTFTIYLQTLFNSNVLGTTATITYDSLSSKISISLTNNYQIEVIETQLWTILGFNAGQKSNVLISQHSYNFNHDLYVNMNINNTISSFRNDNITIKIPVNVNHGKLLYLFENDLFHQELHLNDSVLYRLNISIYDRYGNQLSNNGVNWSMTLQVE